MSRVLSPTILLVVLSCSAVASAQVPNRQFGFPQHRPERPLPDGLVRRFGFAAERKQLRSKDPAQRLRALVSLAAAAGEHRAYVSPRLLVAGLADGDVPLRRALCRGLLARGPTGIPETVAARLRRVAREDTDATCRFSAAAALLVAGWEASANWFDRAAKDAALADADAALAAVRSLVGRDTRGPWGFPYEQARIRSRLRLGAKLGMPILRRALASKSPAIRSEAVRMAGVLRDRARPLYTAMLRGLLDGKKGFAGVARVCCSRMDPRGPNVPLVLALARQWNDQPPPAQVALVFGLGDAARPVARIAERILASGPAAPPKVRRQLRAIALLDPSSPKRELARLRTLVAAGDEVAIRDDYARLGRFAVPAIPTLLEFGKKHPPFAGYVVRAATRLADFATPQQRSAMIRGAVDLACNDPSAALAELRGFGKDALLRLTHRGKLLRRTTCTVVCRALASDPALLRSLTKSPDAVLRGAAINALSCAPSSASISCLVEALTDPVAGGEVEGAFGRIAGAHCEVVTPFFPRLVALVQEHPESLAIAYAMRWFLHRLEPAQLAAIEPALHKWATGNDPNIELRAAVALLRLGRRLDPVELRVAANISRCAPLPGNTPHSYVWILRNATRGRKRLFPAEVAELDRLRTWHDDPHVRLWATRFLRLPSKARAARIESLRWALYDPSVKVRLAAVRGLSAWSDDAPIPPLILPPGCVPERKAIDAALREAAVLDPSAQVRSAAKHALEG